MAASFQIKENAPISKYEAQLTEEAQLATSTMVGTTFPAAPLAAGAMVTPPLPMVGAEPPPG